MKKINMAPFWPLQQLTVWDYGLWSKQSFMIQYSRENQLSVHADLLSIIKPGALEGDK